MCAINKSACSMCFKDTKSVPRGQNVRYFKKMRKDSMVSTRHKKSRNIIFYSLESRTTFDYQSDKWKNHEMDSI